MSHKLWETPSGIPNYDEEYKEDGKRFDELFETLHMMLFGTMVFFIIEVLFLVRAAAIQEKKWEQAEDIATKPENLALFLEDVDERQMYSDLPLGTRTKQLGYTYERIDWTLQYLAMRAEFISPRDSSEVHLAADFDYGDYLAFCLSHTLAEIVEVPLRTWMQMEFGAIAMYLVILAVDSDVQKLYWISAALLYCNMLFLWLLVKKLGWIKSQLIAQPQEKPPPHWYHGFWFLAGDVSEEETQGLLKEEGMEMSQYGSMPTPGHHGEIHNQADVHHRPKPRYLTEQNPVTERSAWGKWLLGDIPNPHERLFWFDRKGPAYIESYIRVCLLLMAVYLPVMGITLFQSNRSSGRSIAAFVVKAAIALVGWFLSFQLLVKISAQLEVSNVEMMRKRGMIDKVKAAMLSKKVIKLFRVLNKLRTYAQVSDDSRMMEDPNTSVDLSVLDERWKASIRTIFNSYDVDRSGTLDESEMLRFLHSLGKEATAAKASALCKHLDRPDPNDPEANVGDGKVSCDEFLQWMWIQQNKNEEMEPESLEDVAQGMFKLFDTDNSGTISSAELSVNLAAWGVQVSDEELRLLMQELDPNNDGTITLGEFTEMLERHDFEF